MRRVWVCTCVRGCVCWVMGGYEKRVDLCVHAYLLGGM